MRFLQSFLICLLLTLPRGCVRQLPAADISPKLSATQSDLQQRARAALVRVNRRCSGVCVHPDGWILSAAHCFDFPKVSEWKAHVPGLSPWRMIPIQFDGQPEMRAELRHIAAFETGTDLAVLKLPSGKGLPHLPVSQQAPRIGDQVYTVGYPAGTFSYTETKIKAIGNTEISLGGRVSGSRVSMGTIETEGYVSAGNSGGPLVTANGEVIGILSVARVASEKGQHAPPGGYWADWNSLNQALQVCGVRYGGQQPSPETNDRLTLIVLTRRGCSSCIVFHRDYEAGLKEQLSILCDVQIVSDEHPRFAEICADYGVQVAPSFILISTSAPPQVIADYTGPKPLLDAIAKATLPISPAPSDPPLPRVRNHPPVDIPDPSLSSEHLAAIEAVVLVGKRDFESMLFETAVTAAERNLAGVIERKIRDRLQGKITVHLVFQRIEPDRFDALKTLAGFEEETKGGVLLLVKKSLPDGLLGVVLKKAAEIVHGFADERLQGVPVAAICERNDYQSADWQRAVSILSAPSESHPASWPWLTGSTSLFAFLAAALNRLRGRKAVAA